MPKPNDATIWGHKRNDGLPSGDTHQRVGGTTTRAITPAVAHRAGPLAPGEYEIVVFNATVAGGQISPVAYVVGDSTVVASNTDDHVSTYPIHNGAVGMGVFYVSIYGDGTGDRGRYLSVIAMPSGPNMELSIRRLTTR